MAQVRSPHKNPYTTQMLSLAVELAAYPMLSTPCLGGHARSRACGSNVEVSLRTDLTGKIAAVGVRVSACAMGQAAAAIFARHCSARNKDDISQAAHEIAQWLASEAASPKRTPAWPDIALLAPAIPLPARHPSIMLAWNAAQDALSKVTANS